MAFYLLLFAIRWMWIHRFPFFITIIIYYYYIMSIKGCQYATIVLLKSDNISGPDCAECQIQQRFGAQDSVSRQTT